MFGWIDQFSTLGLADLGAVFGYDLEDLIRDLSQAIVPIGAGLVRLAGRVVKTGETGLKFSFGRVVKEVGPGFYPLIPMLQTIRVVPTRARTLDIPDQRVTSGEGLVYTVNTNLTYQIVDVRAAVVEVDNLQRALMDTLAMVVHDLIRGGDRALIADRARFDAALVAALSGRVSQWGVEVREAGLVSVWPTPATVQILQLDQVVRERQEVWETLVASGLSSRRALAVLGSRVRYLSPTRRRQRMSARHRRQQAVQAKLRSRGWAAHRVRELQLRLGAQGDG